MRAATRIAIHVLNRKCSKTAQLPAAHRAPLARRALAHVRARSVRSALRSVFPTTAREAKREHDPHRERRCRAGAAIAAALRRRDVHEAGVGRDRTIDAAAPRDSELRAQTAPVAAADAYVLLLGAGGTFDRPRDVLVLEL